MEGWDAGATGGVTDEVRRRWRRFGESGAKLICGGEAMAVRIDGRANPRQLVVHPDTEEDLRALLAELRAVHLERYGETADLACGFQLTHSGRFCKPWDNSRLEPRVAFRHPILDSRFRITSDSQVFTDDELDELVGDFVRAARVAWKAGADFVDIKHCHGYLLHELLGAHTRPGRYGGCFENRTRMLRNIVQGIRADANPIDLGVRLSAFDLVPFKPDPEQSHPGKPGPGIPEDFQRHLPYTYGFGVNQQNPLEYDLSEPIAFLRLCRELGVKIVNLTAGSPYYNPHIQRPAAYPPSDGYQPPEDPLCGVARQIHVTRELKKAAGDGLVIVGTGYSYLQEYLPHVAQEVLRQNWVDSVGIGRMVLSYPEVFTDAINQGRVDVRRLCRTLSDCTSAPRNGLISGCYPLDDYYRKRWEAGVLREMKGVRG
jgi:2,4-dienoyl-CoA reductase-like NADH-dependent reductase (Old Yellow Enzyme family)